MLGHPGHPPPWLRHWLWCSTVDVWCNHLSVKTCFKMIYMIYYDPPKIDPPLALQKVRQNKYKIDQIVAGTFNVLLAMCIGIAWTSLGPFRSKQGVQSMSSSPCRAARWCCTVHWVGSSTGNCRSLWNNVDPHFLANIATISMQMKPLGCQGSRFLLPRSPYINHPAAGLRLR